jgi:hypothetical protein
MAKQQEKISKAEAMRRLKATGFFSDAGLKHFRRVPAETVRQVAENHRELAELREAISADEERADRQQMAASPREQWTAIQGQHHERSATGEGAGPAVIPHPEQLRGTDIVFAVRAMTHLPARTNPIRKDRIGVFNFERVKQTREDALSFAQEVQARLAAKHPTYAGTVRIMTVRA